MAGPLPEPAAGTTSPYRVHRLDGRGTYEGSHHDGIRLAQARIPPAHSSSYEKYPRVYSAKTARKPLQPVTDARVTEFYRQYLAVAVFALAAFVMVGGMLLIARILRPRVPQSEKYVTYESGSDPLPLFGQANVRYYVYALLFVIFDVEAVFIFPWAIQVDALAWFGLVEITVFVVVLLIGLAYVWRKGLLQWA